MLIGTSTAPGTFTEAIVKDMAAHTQRPIIFPLSNPTHLMEAKASDLITWTDGRALVATGIPSRPVTYKGDDVCDWTGQQRTALSWSGSGHDRFACAQGQRWDVRRRCQAVADLVDAKQPGASLLPHVENLRTVSATVAVEVAKKRQPKGWRVCSSPMSSSRCKTPCGNQSTRRSLIKQEARV